eukprot:Nitzschia sp. Nitz4//scaffold22_size323478//53992//54477//NITZ4_000507-RA/size323478-snap-gene-0.497-mRNA-1//1//CDS//3329542935//6032//frame0
MMVKYFSPSDYSFLGHKLLLVPESSSHPLLLLVLLLFCTPTDFFTTDQFQINMSHQCQSRLISREDDELEEEMKINFSIPPFPTSGDDNNETVSVGNGPLTAEDVLTIVDAAIRVSRSSAYPREEEEEDLYSRT